MKIREPDSARLVAAFGPNIFFDEFCHTHVMFTDHPLHGALFDDEEPDPPCHVEDIATVRCPGCNDRVPAEFLRIHYEEIHGGLNRGA